MFLKSQAITLFGLFVSWGTSIIFPQNEIFTSCIEKSSICVLCLKNNWGFSYRLLATNFVEVILAYTNQKVVVRIMIGCSIKDLFIYFLSRCMWYYLYREFFFQINIVTIIFVEISYSKILIVLQNFLIIIAMKKKKKLMNVNVLKKYINSDLFLWNILTWIR